MIVYISIGNSDDKLTQAEWARFLLDVDDAISDGAITVHGRWYSAPRSAYQNACWCAEFHEPDAWHPKMALQALAATYRQDSIAWAEATTEFLTLGQPEVTDGRN